MSRKFILCFLLILTSHLAFSQKNLDSLITLYHQSSLDKKIELFYVIAPNLSEEMNDSTLYFINDLLTIGIERNREDAIAVANKGMASYLRRNELFSQALQKIENPISFFQNIHNDTMLADAYNEKGIIYFLSGDLTSAEIYFKKAKSVAEKGGYYDYTLLSNLNLARLHIRRESYDTALMLIHEYIANNLEYPKHLASGYGLEGQIYLNKDKLDTAKECFTKSMDYALESNNISSIANGYTNLGIVSFLSENHTDAKHYFQIALAYHIKNDNTFFTTEAYYNLGEYYYGMQQLDSAIAKYEQSIISAKSIKNLQVQLDAYVQIAAIYGETNQLKKQVETLEKIIQIQKEISKQQAQKTIRLLTSNQEQTIKSITNIAEKREAKALKKVSLMESSINNWSWIIIISVILLSLIGGLILRRIKWQNKKQH